MALISIITACYNKASFLEETITSVLEQTFDDWELIIVDDHSSDDSVAVIKKFTGDKRMHLICNTENKGGNYSRNLGIKAASGIYLMFLDADDLLEKTCLENRLAKAKSYADGNLWVFGMGVFYQKRGDDSRTWKPQSADPLKDFLQHVLPWSILQPFWRKSFLISLNGFDESFERMQDVELHTRALLLPDVKYYQFPEIVDCHYRIDEQRKNFNAYEFLQRWVRSAFKYILKFKDLVKPDMQKFLSGTLLKTFGQVIFYYRQSAITAEQFEALKKEFLQLASDLKWNKFQKSLLNVFSLYNRAFPRIPGINRLLTPAIIYSGR